MASRLFNILNLGGGVQSSRVLLGSCIGEITRFDAAVFADTMWEPARVYQNLDFLRSESSKAGIPLVVVTAGESIREEALHFMSSGRTGIRGRYASLPMFIKNTDGSRGRMRRQCTSEYKIKIIEQWIRGELLGLRKGERVPRGVTVAQWFGISDDEASRVSFPGLYRVEKHHITTSRGKVVAFEKRKWRPSRWKRFVYPLLNMMCNPNRTTVDVRILPKRERRDDCIKWLYGLYPDRKFPRSACIGCPFHSNREWLEMKLERPDEWEDACRFDESARILDYEHMRAANKSHGLPYLHSQLVPLRMADLGGQGEKGGGCGTVGDDQAGICDT